MKNILVCTVLFLSSFWTALGCGYSPYGEDIRYCLFAPHYFNYQDFSAFNYNANYFGFDTEKTKLYESNIYDWYNYTDKKVTIEAIDEFLNLLKITDIHPESKNEFIQYLYKNNKQDVLLYLTFAKRSEVINALDLNDPWERNEEQIEFNRNAFLNEIVQAYQKEKNKYLKRKYAFLAIRVAYYSNDSKKIQSIFKQEFNGGKKDYIYYWSLYFYSFFNPNAFVDLADIMAYSSEKRNACYYYFHQNFDLEKTLQQASTKSEISNIYAFASVQKLDQGLNYLKEIYKNNSKSRILSFLLIREINKIEDWVYTPYYTNYLPSTLSWFDQNDILTTNTLRNRSEKDRLYAKELLNFVNSINYSAVENPMLWKASEIQLLFLTKRFDDCLLKIGLFEKAILVRIL